MVGISLSASETDDRFHLSAQQSLYFRVIIAVPPFVYSQNILAEFDNWLNWNINTRDEKHLSTFEHHNDHHKVVLNLQNVLWL